MEPVGQARAGQLDDARGAAREVLAVEDVDVRLLSRGRRRRAEGQDPDAVAEAAWRERTRSLWEKFLEVL